MVFSFSTARLLFFVNFAPIVSLIILVAFIKTNVTFSDTINRVFFLVCAAAFFLVVADSTRFVTARMPHPSFLRYFSKSFGYILRVSIIYLTTLIAKRGKTKKIFLYSLPLLLCIILTSINLTSLEEAFFFLVMRIMFFTAVLLVFLLISFVLYIHVFFSIILLKISVITDMSLL